MRLHELVNNQTAIKETLKYFIEEKNDECINWCDRNVLTHLQVNRLNGTVYILTNHFMNLLDLSISAIRERKKPFDPFYLDPKAKQVELGRKIEGKKSSSQECTEEEKPKKSQRRLPLGERINIDYVVSIDEHLTDYERDMIENAGDRGYISYKHLLLECEPKYIDRYTTAYNSDIMRAILSHQ